jgi:hypothetical protein
VISAILEIISRATPALLALVIGYIIGHGNGYEHGKFEAFMEIKFIMDEAWEEVNKK